MHDGVVLTGVQVAPAPFRLVIVKGAGSSALRARPTGQLFMVQVDMHLAREMPVNRLRLRTRVFRFPECAGRVLDLPCLLDAVHRCEVRSWPGAATAPGATGHRVARMPWGDPQGGFQRSGLKPLLWGEPPLWAAWGEP